MPTLPNGFEKITKEQTAEERVLSAAFSEVAERNGYDCIFPSAVYPSGESFIDGSQRYKFVDRDGEILSLNDDVIAGLMNAVDREIERLYAFSEVYSYRREVRNIRQCGALLTGVGGIEAECELIRFGLDFLDNMGIPGGKIAIGNTFVLQGLAELTFGYRPDMETLLKKLENGPKNDAEATMFGLMSDIRSLHGGAEVIRPVAEVVQNRTSGLGLEGVLNLYDALCGLGLSYLVEIDFSLAGRRYDNGSLFEIRDSVGNVLLFGGRHDFCYGKKTVRAVSLLMEPQGIIPFYQVRANTQKNVVLGVAEGTTALSNAYKLKESFAEAGVSVTTLYRTDVNGVVEYALRYGIESAVYVDERGRIATVK